MNEVVIFDFDGVLVESAEIKTKAFTRLFEAEGEDMVARIVDYHTAHAGVSRFEKFYHIYREIIRKPLDEETFRRLCERFAMLVVEDIVHAPYVRGAKEFLDCFASKYSFFVCSATPQMELEAIVARRGITSSFDGIYGAPRKKAEIVGDIITRTGCGPTNTVYIGDALSDYEAAKAHGIPFIARINDNAGIFDSIDCPKIRDLTHLYQWIACVLHRTEDKL